MKRKVGQPAAYETVDEMRDKINEYFEYIEGKYDEENEVWVRKPERAKVTALALYLGFSSRQSLYDYEKKPQFTYIIKRAKTYVECEYEENLFSKNVTGSIFALKNMGWSDKIEQTVTQTNIEVDMSNE